MYLVRFIESANSFCYESTRTCWTALWHMDALCSERCEGHWTANGLQQPRMELAESCHEHTYLGRNHCELRLRSTPRYRLVCICFPTPGRGWPYGSGLGLSRCLGPGECLQSFSQSCFTWDFVVVLCCVANQGASVCRGGGAHVMCVWGLGAVGLCVCLWPATHVLRGPCS